MKFYNTLSPEDKVKLWQNICIILGFCLAFMFLPFIKQWMAVSNTVLATEENLDNLRYSVGSMCYAYGYSQGIHVYSIKNTDLGMLDYEDRRYCLGARGLK